MDTRKADRTEILNVSERVGTLGGWVELSLSRSFY